MLCAGKWVEADEHEVTYRLFLGKGTRLDSDNASKLILDGLAEAGCFRNRKGIIVSDASVAAKHEFKARDWANPRTEIEVRALVAQSRRRLQWQLTNS